MNTLRVLPADVYDALELSAWAFGGIGAKSMYDAAGYPLCLLGHIAFADTAPCFFDMGEMERSMRTALRATDPSYAEGRLSALNDEAVHAINKRHGNAPNARVPFNKWAAELNVVRGER